MGKKIYSWLFDFRKIGTFVIIFLIAGIITAIPLLASGFNPLKVYYALLYGGFGSVEGLARTLTKMAPLLFCSLGTLISYKAGVWNIGGEGQLYMGALGTLLVGLFLKDIPMPLHLFLAAVASMAAGGLWSGIAGFFRVKFRANEIIVTLLQNFIAIWIIFYVVRFPLKGKAVINPVSDTIALTARWPIIFPGTSLHLGILLALALSFVIWFGMSRTVFGYQIKAIGSNPEAATYGGISVSKVVMICMVLSGCVAGLAGMSEVSGVHYLLADNISLNYGYLGISAALLARLNPLGAILSSLFMGGLLTGARFAQIALGVPSTLVYMIMGIFIIALVLETYLDNLFSSLLKRLKNGRTRFHY
jgi:simple sugar transport system permease protein